MQTRLLREKLLCKYLVCLSLCCPPSPLVNRIVPARITNECLCCSWAGEKGKCPSGVTAGAAGFWDPLAEAQVLIVLCHCSSSVQTSKCWECWFGLFKVEMIGFYDAEIARSTFSSSLFMEINAFLKSRVSRESRYSKIFCKGGGWGGERSLQRAAYFCNFTQRYQSHFKHSHCHKMWLFQSKLKAWGLQDKLEVLKLWK